MAEVLLAVQRSDAGTVDDLVILKRMLPRFRAESRFVQRFLDEAKLVSSLRHPNIVEIREVVREDGEYSIVMEYVSGEDVSFLLAETSERSFGSQFPIEVACAIVHAVARALEFAHTPHPQQGRPRGIVHRDVSPSNIMLTYAGVVKVIDFGLATSAHAENSNPGHIKGKLPYASPEYLQDGAVTARSDLFSLGSVFHELLTARRLFDGPSQGMIIHNVLERHIPPPSIYNPDVPHQLDGIVMSVLERDPGRRMGSTAELVTQLESFLAERGVGDSEALLAKWMKANFSERWQERLTLEKEVVQAATSQDWPTEIAPAFSNPSGSGSFDSSQGTSALSRLTASWPAVRIQEDSSPTTTSSAARGKRISAAYQLAAACAVIAVALWIALAVKSRGGAAPAATTSDQAQPAGQDSPDALEPVQLQVTTTPVGARVVVGDSADSALVGTDGVDIAVPPGKPVTLTFSADGYGSKEVVVQAPLRGSVPVFVSLSREIAKGEPVTEQTPPREVASAPVRLSSARKSRRSRRANGVVSFTVQPKQAVLFVDEQRQGAGLTHRITLTEGTHSVRVTADGFEDWSRDVEVVAKQTTNVSVTLTRERRPHAIISVHSQPAGAAVTIDGAARGNTPVSDIEVPVDKRVDIVVKKSGYIKWSRKKVFEDRQVKTVRATLTRVSAREPAPGKPTVTAPSPKPPVKPVSGSARSMKKISGRTPVVVIPGQNSTATAPVKICVDGDGKVTSARATGLSDHLREPIEAAIRRWRYKPVVRNGAPTPVCFSQRVRFRIRSR